MTNITALIIIGIVVVFVLACTGCMWNNRRRRLLGSKLMCQTAPILPQQRQQLPRRNFPRQRACRTRPNFTDQPAYPTRPTTTIVHTYRSPNTSRPLHQSNSAVAEPFPSITLPERVHSPVPEHDHPDVTVDLVERMRQVQTVMLEIHRLEDESRRGMNHRQRIQELQRRVMKLSDTTSGSDTGTTTDTIAQRQLHGVGTSEPPPAYVR